MSEKRNLQDIATALSAKLGISKKEAELFLKEALDSVQEGLLKDKSVKINRLGTLKLIAIAERESVDVTTGNRVVLPAHYKISFTPDDVLSETVNEPFALFENVELDEDAAIEADEEEEEESFSDSSDSSELEVTEVIEVAEVPIVSTAPEEETIAEKEEEPSKKCGWWWFAATILVILLGLGICAYLYYQRDKELLWTQDEIEVIAADTTVQSSLPVVTNPVVPEKVKEIPASAQKTATITEQSAKDDNPYNAIDGSNANPYGAVQGGSTQTYNAVQGNAHTHIMKAGERLTVIALREYGNKSFWVYIYEENKARIPNPDNVAAGTEIKLPAPAKYGINAQDTGSVRKAHDLAMKLEEQLWNRKKY
jgi:nucleoid DNA-binding protein